MNNKAHKLQKKNIVWIFYLLQKKVINGIWIGSETLFICIVAALIYFQKTFEEATDSNQGSKPNKKT